MAILLLLMLSLISLHDPFIIAEVVIENNGYRGLIVAIHEDVKENIYLLESIKDMIAGASPMLYKITKQRAFFESATIVVPSTWSTQPEYKIVSKHDYLSSAEMRVASSHPSCGHIPFTQQLGGCGERGQFIHVTPEFLLESPTKKSATENGRKSKIFLHLWARLRYGVFNENGERGNPKYPMFYRDGFNKIRPNSCTLNIKGRIRRSDGKSPCTLDINENLIDDCTFYPDLRTGKLDGTGKASLLYMPELDSADEFCDDENKNNQHNPSAPNIHNRMCNARSALDIVLNNEDFVNQSNLPRNIANLTTEINVIQVRSIMSSSNFVLLLDISGSMHGQPLKHLQVATSRLIQFHIKDACNVNLGMVSFAYDGHILSKMTPVNNSSKAQLIKNIPNSVQWTGTGIGNGILKAIELLRQGGDSIENSIIILLSDGEENSSPTINEIIDKITRSGVIIYTLAFGDKASKHLEELSHITNGKSAFYDPTKAEISLDSILSSMIIDGGCNEMSIVNSNSAIVIANGTDTHGDFNVDSGVASTVVFISYSYPKDITIKEKYLVMTISDPNGKKIACTEESLECKADRKLRSIQFKIDKAMSGKWKYRLENPANVDAHVSVVITYNTQEQNKANLIRVKSWLSEVNLNSSKVTKIFTEVKKGNVPVIRARVTATAHRPDGTEEKITLNDNGIGADIYANDGVYAEYFTRYNGIGRYSVDVNVENTKDTRLNTMFYSEGCVKTPALPILLSGEGTDEPSEEFLLSELTHLEVVYETSAIYKGESKINLNYETMERVNDFQRFSSAGTFFINMYSTSVDLIPPSKVTDLTVIILDHANRIVRLEWTSPGDDMYGGRAAAIDLRFHYDVGFLMHSFASCFSQFTITRGSLIPQAAYEIHSVDLQLTAAEEGFSAAVNSSRNVYFALKAVDNAGNMGEVSNVVVVDFTIPKQLITYWYTIYKIHIVVIIIVSIGISSLIIIIICFARKNSKKRREIV